MVKTPSKKRRPKGGPPGGATFQRTAAYALQAMPDCVVIEAESTKGMARELIGGSLLTTRAGAGGESLVPLQSELSNAPRGSLAIHSLVP